MKSRFIVKVVLSVVFVSFSLNVYSFWIWSPKTQKWKNPKYSALATPYLQFKEAEKMFKEERHKEAYKSFKKLLANYPDSQEAAEAQYFLAQCLEKLSKPYEAYSNYQKLIDSYPNSRRINEVVERIYNIGEYFLNRENKKLLGMSVYDFVDHPAIEIFQRIVDKVPYSEYAPRAQYKLGMIFMQLGRFDEARDAFQKTIDSYSDSEWAAPAKYQLALATAKAFPGAEYDSTYLKQATSRLDEFISEHPEADISTEARAQLKKLRNSEGKKTFEIAQFYERQDKYKSALIYYRKIINNYSDTIYYDGALEKAREVDEIIKQQLTRSQYDKQKKIEAVENKKAKIRRDKQDKIDVKQALKRSKMKETLAKIEARDKRRQELLRDKNIAKEGIRLQKLKEVQASRVKKEVALIEKTQKREQVRERKLKIISEKKIKKEVDKLQKIQKKEEARRKSLRKKEEAKVKKEVKRQQKIEKIAQARLQKLKIIEEKKVSKEVVVLKKTQKKEEVKVKKEIKKQKKIQKREEVRERKLKIISEKKAKKEAARLKKLRKKETISMGGLGAKDSGSSNVRQDMADEQLKRVQESLDDIDN